MILGDTGRLALRNLREAVLRTVLTALGVAIGIASLVGMVSFGVAIEDQVLGSFRRSGVFDSITVTPAATPAFGRGNRRPAAAPARPAKARSKLDDAAVRELAKLDGVKEVIPDVRMAVEAVLGDITEATSARGVAMSARNEGAFRQVTFGRFFANDQETACLLSLEFARRLSQNAKALVGKDLTLRYVAASDLRQLNPMAMAMGGGLNIKRNERVMRIVGIVERPTGPMLGMFSSIMVPLGVAQSMGSVNLGDVQNVLSQLSDTRSYSLVTVKVRRAQDLEDVEQKIKEMGFGAFSIADALESQKKAFVLLDLFLGLVGSIALTVASLGIVNTMVMSILERTREIGVMKAIGASDRDVRRIFLVEASLIGLIGGASGVFLGWVVGRAINAGANYYLNTQGVPATNLFVIPWWLMAGALAFALGVSLVAGAFPAARAARLDPIRALRHD